MAPKVKGIVKIAFASKMIIGIEIAVVIDVFVHNKAIFVGLCVK